MTGINASKIIQNLQFLNSFAPHHCSRAAALSSKCRGNREETGNGEIRETGFGFFLFRNWVRCKPPAPLNRGGGWQESLLRLLNGTRFAEIACCYFGNGTYSPMTGSLGLTGSLATSRRKIRWFRPEFRIGLSAENCKAERAGA